MSERAELPSTRLQAAFVVATFVVVAPAAAHLWALPPGADEQPVILVGALMEWPVLISLMAMVLLIALRGKDSGWDSIEGGDRIRLFVAVPVLIFAWTYSTYDINEFFGHVHVWDRLALLSLAAGVWLHPLVLLPFYLQTSLVLGQLDFPLPGGSWHWPDKQLPFDVLGICAVFAGLHALIRLRSRALLLAVILVTGATYVNAAVAKATAGPDLTWWALENRLSNVSVGAYTNGRWLRSVDLTTLPEFWSNLDRLQPLTGLGTLAIEGGGILLVLARPALMVALTGFVALHLGILATTGIFFWK